MLQADLEERFSLATHRETKELIVYALVVAKNGAKIKKADSGEDDMTSRRGHLTAPKASMDRLARFLAGPNLRLGRPVIDKTGLDGVFDFNLDWTPEGYPQSSGDAPPLDLRGPTGATRTEAGGAKSPSRSAHCGPHG